MVVTFNLTHRTASFTLSAPTTLGVSLDAVIRGSGGETYDGTYQVTPKVKDEVVLLTKGKTLRDDVTVLKIPQFEVSNEEGGKTLIIGDEYHG